MTKLLVSVRSATEALEALAGGADVIDVKEPRLGSLGAAAPATLRSVRIAVHTCSSMSERKEIALSAAFGELLAFRPDTTALQLDGYAYAKVGLAGCADVGDWESLWQKWMGHLPALVAPVAVIYADYRVVQAPNPEAVLRASTATRAGTILVDTCTKSGGDLFDWMTAEELTDIVRRARWHGFRIALAGSITLARLSAALRYQPDWIAVRGAVCQAGRESMLERDLVERFVMQMSTPNSMNAAAQTEATIDSVRNRA